MAGLLFEQFEVGQVFDHEVRRTVTDMDNMLFCSLTYNPAPVHIDHAYCAETEFGRPLMNSIFILGLVVGLSVQDTTFGTTVANLGMSETKFPAPVFAGDTLRAQTHVRALRPNASRPGHGIVTFEHLGFNQRDELICSGMAAGSVKLAVVATETLRAMLNLGSYFPCHPRLVAMTWGAEDLAAAIGATGNKDAGGEWTFPYQVARAQCLFAAAAAEVLPLETLYADFRDPEGLERSCRRARRDGFVGRVAIHPDQVGIINRVVSPTPEQLAAAQVVIDAFAAAPDAGTVGIDGKMYDIPHLKAAKRTLAGA